MVQLAGGHGADRTTPTTLSPPAPAYHERTLFQTSSSVVILRTICVRDLLGGNIDDSRYAARSRLMIAAT